MAAYHWQRLWAGFKALEIEVPPTFSPETLIREIENLVKKNKAERGAKVRLQVGPATGGFGKRGACNLYYIIEVYPIKCLKINNLGLNISFSKNHKIAPNAYSSFKTGNMLSYFGAAQEAAKRGLDDVLLLTLSGHIGESSCANVFWEEGAQLYTPPLSEGIVGGVARHRLLEVLSQDSLPPLEEPLFPERLLAASAIYLTSAVQGIRWVARCESRLFSAGRSQTLFNRLFGIPA